MTDVDKIREKVRHVVDNTWSHQLIDAIVRLVLEAQADVLEELANRQDAMARQIWGPDVSYSIETSAARVHAAALRKAAEEVGCD